MANLNLNLSHIVVDDFSPLPAGSYDVMIDNAEVVTSKQGNDMLKVTFAVINHDRFNSRKLWTNYTLNHEIGMKMMKSLAIAIMVPDPNMISDTNDFIGGKCNVTVKLEDNGTYGPQNKISSYRKMDKLAAQPPVVSQAWNPVNDTPPPVQAQVQQQSPQAPPQQPQVEANQGTMPWGNTPPAQAVNNNW